jgi:hypothetical protein
VPWWQDVSRQTDTSTRALLQGSVHCCVAFALGHCHSNTTFCRHELDPGLPTAAPVLYRRLAAELSSQLPTTMGPGSLRVGLLDYLSKIMAAPAEYAAHLKVTCEQL